MVKKCGWVSYIGGMTDITFESACLELGIDPAMLPISGAAARLEHPSARIAEAEIVHDMTDSEWAAIEDAVPVGSDRRVAINAALFVVATGKPWTLLPERLGKWDAARRKYSRWAHAGHWTKIADAVEASSEVPDSRKRLYRKIALKAERQCELLPEHRARVTGFRD